MLPATKDRPPPPNARPPIIQTTTSNLNPITDANEDPINNATTDEDEDEATNMSDAEVINLALPAIVSDFYERATEKPHGVRDKRLKAIELSLGM